MSKNSSSSTPSSSSSSSSSSSTATAGLPAVFKAENGIKRSPPLEWRIAAAPAGVAADAKEAKGDEKDEVVYSVTKKGMRKLEEWRSNSNTTKKTLYDLLVVMSNMKKSQRLILINWFQLNIEDINLKIYNHLEESPYRTETLKLHTYIVENMDALLQKLLNKGLIIY
jgi:DNA-binding PadR family transcriptional regulator